MKITKKIFVLIVLLFIFFNSQLTARKHNYLTFQVDSQEYVVTVQKSYFGADIIFHGVKTRNLSLDFPGENLFPEVEIEGNHFFITWIHYQKNNVRLCWYDSISKESKMLPFSGFNFIGRSETVFDENQKPWILVFLGNNSNNDDLFIYNFYTREVKNLTLTPLSEKVFLLEKRKIGLIIKTQTLDYKYSYKFYPEQFDISLLKKEEIEWGAGEVTISWNQTTLNSMIGFGDSIIHGKMRMFDLEGDFHPELTFLARLQDIFADEYGETFIINLGVPATTTYDGVQRMHTDFSENKAFFLLLLYGANDVGKSSFSANSSAENLERIVLTARSKYGMFPIISTVPPQKLNLDGVQFYKDQTEALNQKIITMAIKNNIAYVDSYTAFFNHSDGWEACLEDIKGNHPSPTGHEVMADLFKPQVLSIEPVIPVNFSSVSSNPNAISVQWAENFEFDFSHYAITFGYSADQLDRLTQASTNSFIFTNVPFNPSLRKQIYLKIQAVDQDGNSSSHSTLYQIEFEE